MLSPMMLNQSTLFGKLHPHRLSLGLELLTLFLLLFPVPRRRLRVLPALLVCLL
jgi:hypothetical protein